VDGPQVLTQDYLRAVKVEAYVASAPADQKTLEYYMSLRFTNNDGGLWVFVNPDGSVAANRTVFGTVNKGSEYNESTRLWHTDRFGIPMECYSFVYKFGGKWYADLEALRFVSQSVRVRIYGVPEDEYALGTYLNVKTKSNGELLGFYDSMGKAVTGSFMLPGQESSCRMFGGGVLFLSGGKPLNGTQWLTNYKYHPFYLDPEVGFMPMEWL
jgi:hypothetical protein